MAQARLLGNRYRLDSVVGRGGMGTVWRAFDVMLDREVAVKEVVLPPGLDDSERAVLYERTFREARASARLNHSGVVTVHDVVEESGSPWIVMELVLAPSLQDLLDRGPMDHRRVADIGLQMLGALRHAHEKGILHRDVKPSNVLITDTGRVVLTDFGIAQVEGDATLTQTGLVMGSPAYIPPERVQGERAVPASDLWALGATLYAAVEGRSPYERSDAMSSLQAALTEPVPPARNAGPLARVLDGLLAREPANRMTAAQAQPLLTRVAAMLPPSRPQPPRPAETVTDDESGRYVRGGGRAGDASETVLDPDELDVVTRRDPGEPEPITRNDPVGFGDQGYGPGSGRSLNQGQGQGRPAPYAQPPPAGGGPEARTFRESDWTPPPSRTRQAPGPQTPPPWEQPRQYTNWQQPPPPPVHGIGGDRVERRKTVLVVTIAVLLVVAAVLAGAFILRGKLQSDATAARPPAIPAAL
ncbi:serine/threonine protein kinase, partial [Actinomadura sp. GC306]|uniref:serine/threonine-protein kinase n=1 Tax=Actinomadura sp. GC306 TaxID=2530367 RepID=UPI00104CD103